MKTEMDGWKYYNHAMIPTCAPHETPELTIIESGEIWKNVHGKKTPLLARWTTDFDCKEETNWWYMIRYSPFTIGEMPKSSQKYIRQSLRKCYVQKIKAIENLDALYEVYCSAFKEYKNADNENSYIQFCKGYTLSEKNGYEYWGGYDKNTNKLIGYMVVRPQKEYAELCIAKFEPTSLNLGVSAALYCTILEYYLNGLGFKYISSGSRSINHKTNTEEYKIRHFGYRRVYCKLHISYSPVMKLAVKCLYPFRSILMKMDSNTRIHQINAVLRMEEIVRNEYI